jgi:hypothetical protein
MTSPNKQVDWILEALRQALEGEGLGADFHLHRARRILERAGTGLRVLELAIAAVEAEVRNQSAKSR